MCRGGWGRSMSDQILGEKGLSFIPTAVHAVK